MPRTHDTTADSGAAFIAACLAPLPPGSAPAECPILRRELRQVVRDRWHLAWLEVNLIEHSMETAHFGRLLALRTGQPTTLSESEYRKTLRAAVERMMRTPAPTKYDLGFKRKHLFRVEDKAAAERAIADDEARLAKGRA